MTGTSPSSTALIFEGGGMRAAYTSAFAVTLLEAGIEFPWVGGISAGATNTANFVSRDARRARRCFVDFAADAQFGDVRTWMRGQGLFNAEYIYQRTSGPDQALPFDWEAFRTNPADVRILAFDAESGEEAVWGREDLTTIDDLMVRVRASSTMPVLMPPVTMGGRTYVDGALGRDGGIALTQAQADGYERFVVVLTQERGYRKEPQRFPAYFRAHFRRHPAVAEALLTRWQRYNATLERVFELEHAGRAHVFAPERMPLTNGTRSLSRLAAAHRAGLSQSRRELPALREFLGLS
ncbi:patatin family protein [Brevibacterium salitolerans]|jgi:predicted patatin/cPLA2 family phospholipase|uniref:Patatin-like phospholipase family protein n=1 Tax=Brevibacterium salitolerans TaxID=1403566 RepID=A0ABP5I125_9MICO